MRETITKSSRKRGRRSQRRITGRLRDDQGLTRPRSVDPFDDLTSREREVLELVAAGLSNAEIGGRLGLAEKTVKHYMTAIPGKLQVGSRVEAALLACKAGMRPDEGGPTHE